MSDEPTNGAKPLKQPLALIACCNKPPPGCGYCWYCLERAKAGKRKGRR